MTGLHVKPLNETTWPDFALLAEKHNGVWGGCWCMAFHPEGVGRNRISKVSPTSSVKGSGEPVALERTIG